MLEFLKSIFKIRQLSLNSLRNIFDFKKQVETMRGKKVTKTQTIPILADLKKTLPNQRYKMDFSNSLLTYPPELLWPNCRLTYMLLHVALLLIKPILGFYFKHCCSIASQACEYNWYDGVQFCANLKLPTYFNVLITIFII